MLFLIHMKGWDMDKASSEQYEYRRPKHEYSVDDDGGQQVDEQLRKEFEEWVAQCESDKSFTDK
jgi:hypothetical protein